MTNWNTRKDELQKELREAQSDMATVERDGAQALANGDQKKADALYSKADGLRQKAKRIEMAIASCAINIEIEKDAADEAARQSQLDTAIKALEMMSKCAQRMDELNFRNNAVLIEYNELRDIYRTSMMKAGDKRVSTFQLEPENGMSAGISASAPEMASLLGITPMYETGRVSFSEQVARLPVPEKDHEAA